MKWICKLIGHHWRVIGFTRQLKHGAPVMVCVRCKENGWQMP